MDIYYQILGDANTYCKIIDQFWLMDQRLVGSIIYDGHRDMPGFNKGFLPLLLDSKTGYRLKILKQNKSFSILIVNLISTQYSVLLKTCCKLFSDTDLSGVAHY